MSETEQPNAPTEPTTPADTPAPEPNAPAQGDPPEQQEEERQSRGDRRFAELTARLSAAERREQERERELAFLRDQQARNIAPEDETPDQRWQRIEREADARAEEKLLTRRFHEEGAAQFPDWQAKCADLIKMGADSHIAKLLVDTPGGVRLAAALAEDPSALERIASIQSQHGRAIALGKFAATIEAGAHPGDGTMRVNGGGAAPAPVQMTRAPAPVRPVTGRAAPQFNEYTADPQTLVDRYMKQALENRLRR